MYQCLNSMSARTAGTAPAPRRMTNDNFAPRLVNEVVASPGRSLDPSTQRFYKQALGHDFGAVRVHTDRAAVESARSVDAHAYTVGQNVVFAEGNYAPNTEAGRFLLAHELAHTIQQAPLDVSSVRRRRLTINSPGDAYEREADAFAAISMQPAPMRFEANKAPSPAVHLSRSAKAPYVARTNCSTVTQRLCTGIFSCGYGGSGKCYWDRINKRCKCYGARKPDVPTSKVLEVLLILGLSIALLATIVAALLDPEPVSKLGLAGLTTVEIVALLLLLGYSREEVREMGLDPDLVAQADLGEGSPHEDGGTRVA